MPDHAEDWGLYERAALASAAVYALPGVGEAVPGLPGHVVDAVFSDDECGSGFLAIGFCEPATGHLLLVFCGVNQWIDLASAANLARCQYEPNRERLLRYAREPAWRGLAVAGHSLGGGLAQYLAYDLARRTQPARDPIPVITFNGVGGGVGIKAMYGKVDATIVDRLALTHFVHPDDPIARLGQHLGGRVRLLDCTRLRLERFEISHAIERFLPSEGVSVLEASLDYPDRAYAITQTALMAGEDLRQALLDLHERRYRGAAAGFYRILRRVPPGERLELARFVLSLTRVRRLFRRGVMTALWLRNLARRPLRGRRPAAPIAAAAPGSDETVA